MFEVFEGGFKKLEGLLMYSEFSRLHFDFLQEDAVVILMGLRSKYEEHHKCHITTEAVEAAVYLSARYIADRFLPDKAIDLVDEAGSRARINSFKKRKERQTSILTKSPSEYWQEIRAVQASQETVSVWARKYHS